MNVDLFDFELPEDCIALRPFVPRERGKLLHVAQDGSLKDFYVRDLIMLLREGDALVFNDTRVIKAQLMGLRQRNGTIAKIGVTLHMRVTENKWWAFARPAKRLKLGDEIIFSSSTPLGNTNLIAHVLEKGDEGDVLLEFETAGHNLHQLIAQIGHMPLPPYIALKRGEDLQDEKDYQTIYAKEEGAVAAPTAGLHFTQSLMDDLTKHGIEKHFVTLHVGAGTFLPVKVENTDDHKMHSEMGHIDTKTAAALMSVKKRGNRIVAVGTTALRLLESATDEKGQIQAWSGATNIFITPGYQWRCVDCLMTNFHLPKSTLFMLVSAFSGMKKMREAYNHAIKNGYRFYSYGDTSFLERN
ncbi:tRNA preQ1(34) S-adenosylmethionine ribosyltransferase-isomerase QueA [Bartonella tamiae]|uniref:S-adenosylmethionine:tRNA ribosyltransferase-isomerase n=1 Tax=Bartonella tamiae Th239 TaxID=1094558 RepID=J0ZKR7_9HYPH|nr:tRNA preQ1(34) S-adenosylmethionine ribosyltransferase-isomerase QueA [Bartonella tamiae]EJF88938.1 S-adenosylmethionine:tRNA ribosyltransferase-isomerase [Bartonella tamiae Th239]EJF94812.1 S-adenosylmethionine:tRNA ribosyltransferase-isomerase [Bartonella tamiae Th307]